MYCSFFSQNHIASARCCKTLPFFFLEYAYTTILRLLLAAASLYDSNELLLLTELDQTIGDRAVENGEFACRLCAACKFNRLSQKVALIFGIPAQNGNSKTTRSLTKSKSLCTTLKPFLLFCCQLEFLFYFPLDNSLVNLVNLRFPLFAFRFFFFSCSPRLSLPESP